MNILEATELLRMWQTWLGNSRRQCDENGKVLWDRIDAVLAAAPTPPTQDDWCFRCGCGNSRLGYAHLDSCPTRRAPPPPSRTEFERLIKAQTPNAQLDRAENGEYIVPSLRMMWEGYCMATPPAQEAEPIHRWRPSKGDINKIKMEVSATGKYVRYSDHLKMLEQSRLANEKLRQAAEAIISEFDLSCRDSACYGSVKRIDDLRAALEVK